MQISAASNAPTTVSGRPVARVQPVTAIVRYPETGTREQRTAHETTLEGEFLRGSEGVGTSAASAYQTAIPGTLVNAARAVSAYNAVASATTPDPARARRLLDLHV